MSKKILKRVSLTLYCSFLISLFSIVGSASNFSTDGNWGSYTQTSGGVTRQFEAANRVTTMPTSGHAGAGMQARCTSHALLKGHVELQPRLYRVDSNGSNILIGTGARVPNNNEYARNVSHWTNGTVVVHVPQWAGHRFNAFGRVWAFNNSGGYTEHTSNTTRTPNRTL
jgi:hypothetical protein